MEKGKPGVDFCCGGYSSEAGCCPFNSDSEKEEALDLIDWMIGHRNEFFMGKSIDMIKEDIKVNGIKPDTLNALRQYKKDMELGGKE